MSASAGLAASATAPGAAPADPGYPLRRALEGALAPLVALIAAFAAFAVFLLALGKSPIEFLELLWRGAFGSWFSLQNTLQRAAPLLLTALCVAIPARLGLVIIGGEAAVALGGLAAIAIALPLLALPAPIVWLAMAIAGGIAGGFWIGLSGWLRAKRGVNETIASLVLAYVGIALFNHIVEGPLKDPASLNKPSTFGLPDEVMLGTIPGTDMHVGLIIGILACLFSWVLISRTSLGFAGRVTGGNMRAAQLQGLPVQRLMILACCLGGAFAGLAGMIEVGAVHGRANASLIAGYGWSGILIAFLSRHNPLAIMPMAVLLGGLGAAGGLLQRRMGIPDASVVVLQGFIFVAILASETLAGRFAWFQPRRTDS